MSVWDPIQLFSHGSLSFVIHTLTQSRQICQQPEIRRSEMIIVQRIKICCCPMFSGESETDRERESLLAWYHQLIWQHRYQLDICLRKVASSNYGHGNWIWASLLFSLLHFSTVCLVILMLMNCKFRLPNELSYSQYTKDTSCPTNCPITFVYKKSNLLEILMRILCTHVLLELFCVLCCYLHTVQTVINIQFLYLELLSSTIEFAKDFLTIPDSLGLTFFASMSAIARIHLVTFFYVGFFYPEQHDTFTCLFETDCQG